MEGELIIWFTGALVVFTGVYMIVSFMLWKEMHRTLRVDIIFRYMEYFLQSVRHKLEGNVVETSMKESDKQIEKLCAELGSKRGLDTNDIAKLVKEVKERSRKEVTPDRIRAEVLFDFTWGSKNSILKIAKKLDKKLGEDIEILTDEFEETFKGELDKH